MDPERFDTIVRSLSRAANRRGVLAALLTGLVAPLLPDLAAAKRGRGKSRGGGNDQGKSKDRGGGGRSRGKSSNSRKAKGKAKDRGKGRGKKPHRKPAPSQPEQAAAPIEAEAACFPNDSCTPGPGATLGKCDFGGTTVLRDQNLQGANLGSANLRGADASRAILYGANLGKACLVDTILTDAQHDNTTSWVDAISCRTTMPNGGENNSGCDKGTACCPTCDAAHPCTDPAKPVCCQGRCRAGNCCTDAQCLDPAKPVCLNGVCKACTTHAQCGNGKRCCNGQCKSGNCCTDANCANRPDRPCQRKICDLTTNTCGYTPLANGASCSDGNACTQNDTCLNGACQPGAAVVCTASNECHDPGVCNTTTGTCSNPSKQDGTLCSTGECVGGQCQPICLSLRAVCDPSDNLCCQDDDATACAKLHPGCYLTGAPQNERCCRELGDACGIGCDCCGNGQCENSTCCGHTGSDCATTTDCCQNFLNRQACVSGRCCALADEPCEGPDDCCEGLCHPDGFCTGCLSLQASCEEDTQCCQSQGETNCGPSFDFNSTNCCRPRGGACSENADCCDGIECSNGRCCSAKYEVCETDDECCPGFACRAAFSTSTTKLCRPATCREPGEQCHALPDEDFPCCPEGGNICPGDGPFEACCLPGGSTCEQVPDASSPCCGFGECDHELTGGTCCVTDYFFPGARTCESNDVCCSGTCDLETGNCCRSASQPCHGDGPGLLFSECCLHLALTCKGGTCIPCGRRGQACDPDFDHCCLGMSCVNGRCGGECKTGIGCQEDTVCCPGYTCFHGSCTRFCMAEGEPCVPGFACCDGLTCRGGDGVPLLCQR